MISARFPSFCVLLLGAAGPAQQAGDAGTVSQLARTAEQELRKSIEELGQLREQVASEKLPLAEQLTTLEETVTKRRREHETVTRALDSGSLALANLQTTMQQGRDELDYIGKLLDEYARTFESKVNVSEMQQFGAAVETAKQAPENASLAPAEKFGRQTTLVGASVQRLFDAVGGMRFPGVAVDLQGSVTKGQFLLLGPVALFGAAVGGGAGLVVPQSGSTNPLMRPLEGALQASLASLVHQGEGAMPLDPSRGGALKALVQKSSLIHIFEKGGPIMWPLLAASILALGTVLERVLFLLNERRKRDPKALEALFAAVEEHAVDTAIAIGKKSKDYVVRTLGYALEHAGKSLASAVLYAQAQELKRFRRGISILDTVITLAPLLGLLGTVTGMMGSFSLIGGELSAPGAITGGIAEALIATAFGLGIAITALLPFNFLNTKLEEARREIESAATRLELLAHSPTVIPAVAPVGVPGSATNGPVAAAHGEERSAQPVGGGKR